MMICESAGANREAAAPVRAHPPRGRTMKIPKPPRVRFRWLDTNRPDGLKGGHR